MNTLEVISKILNLNLDIEELKFVELKSSEIVQDNKTINDSAQNQINSALEIRKKHNFPFWDCICSTFINNKSYSKNLLRQVLHHNYNKDVISIHRSLFSEVDQHLSSHKNYAILSRVICKNKKIYHIPFIDFHCMSNSNNISLAEDIVNILRIGSGYLLDSGESFHFIGSRLIEKNEFEPYLGKLLMYTPIIDKSWIAHQLIEKSCALRISYKNGVLPEVIKTIIV